MNNKYGSYVTYNENVNFSTAKQKYSFSKSARFHSNNYESSVDNTGYDLPSTISKRSAGFGIGNRFK